MKRIIAFLVIMLAFVFLAGLTYYFVFQLPLQKNLELELKKEELIFQLEKERDSKIDDCLDYSLQAYRERWERNCEIQNSEINENGTCPLPSDLANHLDEEYKNLRNECLERYKN
jgi:hypothetical protein